MLAALRSLATHLWARLLELRPVIVLVVPAEIDHDDCCTDDGTEDGDYEACGEPAPPLAGVDTLRLCSLPAGHVGTHEAWDGSQCLDTWPQAV